MTADPTPFAAPLTEDWLIQNPPAFPCGPVAVEFPERIIQFGEGNFLRGFADWMVDVMNRRGFFQGRVVVVQPVVRGMGDALNAQDGLYTLLQRGFQSGEAVEDRSIVTAISRCLNPYQDWRAVVDAAIQPSVRFVFSNTTEAGITYVGESYNGETSPASFPAKVTALLLERFRALGGTSDTGWIFLPCELIENNGTTLRECVLLHAHKWHTSPEFIAWIESANVFLNTLVDRIVPGFPSTELDTLRADLGYDDRMIVSAEIFHLWVIEGPARFSEEIPFHQAGLNVIWTDDLTPYRSRKVRVLNGGHTSIVPSAFLAGFQTVREMMDDEDFNQLFHSLIYDEILPFVQMAEEERQTYAADVMDRFRNPFIRHELISIMLNCVSKWRVRVLPTILDYLEEFTILPPTMTCSLASLILFYKGEKVSETELRGSRNGIPYPIFDDAPIIDFFHQQWSIHRIDGDNSRLVNAVMANELLWGRDLRRVTDLLQYTIDNLDEIQRNGVKHTLNHLI